MDGRVRLATLSLLLVLLGAACARGASAPSVGASSMAAETTSAAPTTSGGVAPLSTGSADGGDALLRTRFGGRVIWPLPPSIAGEMRGTTWRRGCPVPMAQLALLRFNYLGFDGEVKRGPMVVNAAVA